MFISSISKLVDCCCIFWTSTTLSFAFGSLVRLSFNHFKVFGHVRFIFVFDFCPNCCFLEICEWLNPNLRLFFYSNQSIQAKALLLKGKFADLSLKANDEAKPKFLVCKETLPSVGERWTGSEAAIGCFEGDISNGFWDILSFEWLWANVWTRGRILTMAEFETNE